MENLENNIEAILFLKGEAMTIKQISKILEKSEDEIKKSVDLLQEKLSNTGIRLLKKDDSILLTTSQESSKYTKELIDEEFNSELTKSTLETLSIIIYRGPVSRSDIDYIRGVNSSYIVRNLLVRGLIERVINPKDSRSFIYKPSFQLLRYLGIEKIEDLPEFGTFNEKLEEFVKTTEENEQGNQENINTVINN